jgi:cyclomaltodextrinase / maltogenic alpha-amylase / neopullulanase
MKGIRMHTCRFKKVILASLLLFMACAYLSTAYAVSTPAPIAPQKAAACTPSPLGKRELFLRGSFNTWGAQEIQKFTYICNRYELITTINGEHKFKIGDEPWSADADFGGSAAIENHRAVLEPIGKELSYAFTGRHRITLDMSNSKTQPTLEISQCDAPPPALNAETIYLRGAMNTWTANEDYAFKFRCDAYYLNVNTTGHHEFRIADVAWSDQRSFAAPAGVAKTLAPNTLHRIARVADAKDPINLRFNFTGEHTLRLAFDGGNAGSPSLSIGPKLFETAGETPVNNLIALSLRYDSRLLNHKRPFGAVTPDTPLSFTLSAEPGISAITMVFEKRRLEGNQEVLEYYDTLRVPMTLRPRDSEREYWTADKTFDAIGVYGYYFEVQIGKDTFIYQNNRDEIPWTRERGTNGIGLISEMPENAKSIRRYRQTIYRSDYRVPEWAKDVVYYYIFPERFRNGSKTNDPKPGVTRFHDHTVELHPKWAGLPYKPNTGDGSDAHYNNDFFGGDLIGIIEKLDYIKTLGANTIYMTPIFHAVSNHKYDTADYSTIDPHFGTNEDFVRFSKEAKKRGIRIILDTSLNHTGSDSLYFDRFKNFNSKGAFVDAKINPSSPYADWYSFDASKADADAQYKGWVGVRDLPELNKASPSFRDFAYGDKNSIMKQWLDRGAAGWRMDVAPWVPDDFWREWRNEVKAHKPNALTIAESYFDSSKFFLGDTFDSTMNYIFRNAVMEYASGKSAINSYRYIEFMREAYPPQSFYALMNLLSSHDQPRSLHVFGYTDEKTDAATIDAAKQKLRLAVFFQMIFPGAPTIYYGDEVGMTGGEDPYNRGPYPWADQGGNPDSDLFAEYKKLIELRKNNPVLRHGHIDAPLLIDEHVIVLLRNDKKTQAITATNNANEPKTLTLRLPATNKASTFVDALSKEKFQVIDGKITITIPARYGLVLVSQ